jgi:hypothetical protein
VTRPTLAAVHAAALAALATLAACDAPPESVDLRRDGGLEVIERTLTIAAGEYAEANLLMGAGDTATAAFTTAGGAVTWDVHSHHGNDVVIHDQGVTTADSVDFTAPARGGFSYLWQNLNENAIDLEVTLTLRGDTSLHSWDPP